MNNTTGTKNKVADRVKKSIGPWQIVRGGVIMAGLVIRGWMMIYGGLMNQIG